MDKKQDKETAHRADDKSDTGGFTVQSKASQFEEKPVEANIILQIGKEPKLSESEKDEFGRPLILSSNGTTIFGSIDAETGLTEAPIRLSLGENQVGSDGKNHGYGLLHIEAGHGDQIRSAGYESVEAFVEDVAKNYTDIREGGIIGNNQTYLLEITDEHNNTLYVQLSRDGKYWNVNSAGIFRQKYSRRKPKVYSVPAFGKGKDTDTSEVNSGQTKGATTPAGNSSETFEDKDTTPAENTQTSDVKVSEIGKSDGATPELQAESRERGPIAEIGRRVRSAAVKLLTKAGIKVHEVIDEDAQRMLDMLGQKNTPLTGQTSRANENLASGSVLAHYRRGSSSSATDSEQFDTAKVQNATQSTKQKIKKYHNGDFKGDYSTLDKTLSSLGRMFSMRSKGGSRYVVLKDDNGGLVAVRFADHKANGDNFAQDNADRNYSFVIERKKYETQPDSEIEYTEVRFSMAEFEQDTKGVVDAIVNCVEKVLQGEDVPARTPDMPQFSIKTYHGSAAKFDQFDHSHMGEGEGAQAYGWGTYVTEVKGIGRTYAESMRDSKWEELTPEQEDEYRRRINEILPDMKLDSSDDASNAWWVLDMLQNPDNEYAPEVPAKETVDQVRKILTEWEKAENDIVGPQAYLYTVEIPDDNGHNYLDWTGTLTREQSSKVLTELKAARPNLNPNSERGRGLIDTIQNGTGQAIIRDLRSYISPEESSILLSKTGFVGIKYPSEYQSGGRKDGAKNYVIFNEADAKIVDRIEFMKDRKGTVYGWTVNGEIFLNRDAVDPATPLHEYTHLWDKYIQKKSPRWWAKGKEYMKGLPLWEIVKNDPNYKNIADNEDLIASEVHARLSGPEGARLLREMIESSRKGGPLAVAKTVTLVEKIKRWLRTANEYIRDIAGRVLGRDLTKFDPDDLVKRPFKELLSEVNPVEEAERPRGGHLQERAQMMMGNRVKMRMKEISEKFGTKENLDSRQKVVADVFGGMNDNLDIKVVREDGEHTIMMRQGSENGAGTKHSVFRHYGTANGVIDIDDIILVPEVMEKGRLTRKMRGNARLNEYKLGKGGITYTVLTEVKDRREIFNDFYTNKKTSKTDAFNTNLIARSTDSEAIDGTKLQNNSESVKPEFMVAREPGRLFGSDKTKGARYGVQESGRRYRKSTDIDKQYPNWLEGTTTEGGKHATQIAGTRQTYKKVGDWIEKTFGKGVVILDASSGMGLGTADLRERGFNIEDVEPYQSEERKANNPATYSSYKDIRKGYDVIISNAVLNVVPDDWRSNVLHDMVSRLKVGGKLFINTRKAGEEKYVKDKIELDSPQEILVKRNGKISSYQRFFTPQELKEYVETELGEGYEVEIANETNSGTKGLAAVVVTR